MEYEKSNRILSRALAPAILASLQVILLTGCASFAPEVPKQPTDWGSLMASGEEAFRKGDYETANRDFSAASKKALEYGVTDMRQAMTLNSLATLAKKRGDLKQAIDMNRAALAIDEKALGPLHPRVATELAR